MKRFSNINLGNYEKTTKQTLRTLLHQKKNKLNIEMDSVNLINFSLLNSSNNDVSDLSIFINNCTIKRTTPTISSFTNIMLEKEKKKNGFYSWKYHYDFKKPSLITKLEIIIEINNCHLKLPADHFFIKTNDKDYTQLGTMAVSDSIIEGGQFRIRGFKTFNLSGVILQNIDKNLLISITAQAVFVENCIVRDSFLYSVFDIVELRGNFDLRIEVHNLTMYNMYNNEWILGAFNSFGENSCFLLKHHHY